MRRALFFVVALTFTACANTNAAGPMPSLPEDHTLKTTAPRSVATSTLSEPYRGTAQKIIQASTTSSGAYEKLRQLSDDIGDRLSGSPSLDRAVAWAAETMKADGHENVHTEKVMVPHWERGIGRGAIVAPAQHALHLLALGGSGGTPVGGIRGEVLVVGSLEELDRRASEAKGRIVLINRAMPAYGPNGSGYGETAAIRTQGPSRSAKYGAIAALTRSLTAGGTNTPHTGATRFEPNITPIPAAAVSTEDAALIARMAARGPVVVELELGARTMPDAESANVVAEFVGRELPEEVVLIAGHLDSWDVGQGSHDDGAGCTMVMEALTVLRNLNLRPRRTIRVVLYTNEENGLRGALEYAKAHAAEFPNFVAAIEADTGGFAPLGFRVDSQGPAAGRMKKIVSLLAPIGATQIKIGGSGADVGALKESSAVLMGLEVEGRYYFDYHHSEADTFDKIDRADLQKDVAAMAVTAYVLAELPIRIGEKIPQR